MNNADNADGRGCAKDGRGEKCMSSAEGKDSSACTLESMKDMCNTGDKGGEENKKDRDFAAHPYFHKVQYYETDKMAVTHHSNYIRWMEESRVDFLERLGCGFDRMEKEGILSPVLEVNCRYRHTTTFADTVAVIVKPRAPGDFKLWLDYKIINRFSSDNEEVAATGSSCHCFLDTKGKPVRLKDAFPDLYNAIVALV